MVTSIGGMIKRFILTEEMDVCSEVDAESLIFCTGRKLASQLHTSRLVDHVPFAHDCKSSTSAISLRSTTSAVGPQNCRFPDAQQALQLIALRCSLAIKQCRHGICSKPSQGVCFSDGTTGVAAGECFQYQF